MLTGVSNARHATIRGQIGAFVSGRDWTNCMSVSAARRPPMLALKHEYVNTERRYSRTYDRKEQF
jgi:hypothetical protein